MHGSAMPSRQRQDDVEQPAGPFPPDLHDVRHLRLKAGLLLLWALASFGAMYFARDLQQLVVAGWPLGYWVGAQGAVLVFIAIVVAYSWAMSRYEREDAAACEAEARAAAAAADRDGKDGPHA